MIWAKDNPQTGEQALTVGEFTRQIKNLLESSFQGVWVRGEISNLRQQSSGHVYFTLKDEGSQLSCVMFRGNASRQPFNWKNGLQVVVYGEVSVYEPRGNYQLICRLIQEDGIGRLQQEFLRLKEKLQGEGLFDPSRKKAIPVLPRTIGVITSPTGAALRDFISILKRRGWYGRLIVLPAQVQGVGACESIVQCLRDALVLPDIDLLVLCRGGGSLEDLWTFNEEALIRAMADCPLPTISAVGHEIDFTLSDFVADRRAETPSAAAELISSGFLDFRASLAEAARALSRETRDAFRHRKHDLALLAARLKQESPHRRIEQSALKLDDLTNRLQGAVEYRLSEARSRFQEAGHRLKGVSPERRLELLSLRLERGGDCLQRDTTRQLSELGTRLNQLGKRLENSGLQKTLARGFTVIRNVRGEVVKSSAQLQSGQRVAASFHDGEVALTVDPSNRPTVPPGSARH